MFNEILPFAFVILSFSLTENYLIQYEFYEKNCSNWTKSSSPQNLRCTIENDQIRRFVSPLSLFELRVKFYVSPTIKRLTLPNEFITSTKTNDFLVRPYSNLLSSLIIIDTTRNEYLEELIILNETFINIFVSSISFIITDCRKPVIKVESNAFRHFNPLSIQVAYRNQTIQTNFDYYQTIHCVFNDRIVFQSDITRSQMMLIKSNEPFAQKSSFPIRFIVNGILLVVLLLITFLLFIHIERKTKINDQQQQQFLSTNPTLSSGETSQLGTRSTSESSATTLISSSS